MINSTNFQFKPIETQTAQKPSSFAYKNNGISTTEKNISEFVENSKKSQNINNLSDDQLMIVNQPTTKEVTSAKKEEPKSNIGKWVAITTGIVTVAALAFYKKEAIFNIFKKSEKIVPKDPEKIAKINLKKEQIMANEEVKTLVESINNSKRIKKQQNINLNNYKTNLKEAQRRTRTEIKEFFKNLSPEQKEEFARLSREENKITRKLGHRSPEQIKAYNSLTKDKKELSALRPANLTDNEKITLMEQLEKVRMKKLSLIHGQDNVYYEAKTGITCVNDLYIESSLSNYQTTAKKYLFNDYIYDGVKSVKKEKNAAIRTIARCNNNIKENALKLKEKIKELTNNFANQKISLE